MVQSVVLAISINICSTETDGKAIKRDAVHNSKGWTEGVLWVGEVKRGLRDGECK